MSSAAKKLLQIQAGAGEAVYVDDVFSTYLYDGNGGEQTINNGIDLDGEGGMLWIKNRTSAYDHAVVGPDISGYLRPNRSNSLASTDHFTFNNNGFTIDGAAYFWNDSSLSSEYVSWTFRKAPKFFDIVTYTGDGTFNRSIPHNLDGQAGMVIVKCTSHAENWGVCHRSATGGSSSLNSTGAFTGTAFDLTLLSDTAFGVQGRGQTNALGQEYIAYVFAHNDGDGEFGEDGDQDIIKCGGYTGNGTAGNEIDLGFEPQWLMIKKASSTGSWEIIDSMRGIVSGGNDAFLRANTSGTEFPNTYDYADLTATGFSLSNDTNVNQSGQDYVYMAIRRPNKPASEFAATDLFETAVGLGNPPPNFISGFPVDMYFNRKQSSTDNWDWSSRLTQGRILQSNLTNAESTNADFSFDYQNGVMSGGYTSTLQSWMFRRAPGFFDVVTYTGDGVSGRTVDHNLGVTPEMMWVKRRDGTGAWWVWHSSFTGSRYLNLDASSASSTSSTIWNNTLPSSSSFTVGNNNTVNGSNNDFVAYLFATVPGISKVGSYSGTGSNLTIDCGFSSGARFVLIKSTTFAGGWHLWDSVRGITTGNDYYIKLNGSGAQTTDSVVDIEPDSSGFILNGPNANINSSGEEYIFLAIA